jgi:hypothetical protein
LFTVKTEFAALPPTTALAAPVPIIARPVTV